MNQSQIEKGFKFTARLFFMWLGVFYPMRLLFANVSTNRVLGASFMMFLSLMNLFFLINEEIWDRK